MGNLKQPEPRHATLSIHAVPAHPLLVTRVKHFDPGFAQNEACETRPVFYKLGCVYLNRKSKAETSGEACLRYDWG